MIKNIVFDFGKVLVDYDFDVVLSKWFTDRNEAEQFKQLVASPEFVDMCDLGEKSFDQIMEETKLQYPKWKNELQNFDEHFTDFIICEMPGMRSLLLKLKNEGFRLYGLTNWSCKVYSVMEKFDILKMLDGRIISSEEKIIKPDLRIFQRLLEKFNLIPAECVFTDDKAANVEGAKNAGMQAIHFHDAEQFEKELREVIEQQGLNEHNKEEYAPAHSAEHLLNQTMIRMFGCERSRNTHIERKKSKMNFNLAECPTEEQIKEVERSMNQLIDDNLSVSFEYVTRDNIPEGVVLDKLPEDASETLRIVRIGDYDICACIGNHVKSTKEIGNFRITSTTFKDGSFRIVYKVDE